MIVWLGLGLAVVLIISKLLLLPFEVFSVGQFLRWSLRLGLVVAADLTFVLALSSCCWLMAVVPGALASGGEALADLDRAGL